MIESIFAILLDNEQPIHKYQCTTEQLKVASEVFIPCQDEKHFQICYEASIREYCTLKVMK